MAQGKGDLTHLELFETPTHIAFKEACKEYFKLHERLLTYKSKRSASHARKALKRCRDLAQRRRVELLTLYSTDPKRQSKYLHGNHNDINSNFIIRKDYQDGKNEKEEKKE